MKVYVNKDGIILVLGHKGLVGSAILRRLEAMNYHTVVVDAYKSDLTKQKSIKRIFKDIKPNYVFNCAAKVGGIMANSTYPAEFIYDNIMISSNVIEACYQYEVKKLMNFGSSCIYPKYATQPIKEEELLTGELEPTNEPYAIAKIAAIKMCKAYNDQYDTDYISVMPTNLYGPGDNYDVNNSHVVPGLIAKIYTAMINREPSVTLWGDGTPLRELLYVDDLADACIMLMEHYSKHSIGEFINIGSGDERSIKDIANTIKYTLGYTGTIEWDTTYPNGTPRKVLDCSRILGTGWKPSYTLEKGIQEIIKDYIMRRL